jgi:hypothetical protein
MGMKMGENETRHRLAEGSRLAWWVSPRSLDLPWWAGWLAASCVVAAAVFTWVSVSGSWAVVVYIIGLCLLGLVRRRVIHRKRA